VTPDQIARLRELMEKAKYSGGGIHADEYRIYVDELVNSAPDLLDAAERDAGECPMIDAEPERVIVTGLAHCGCRLCHAVEVRPDATFDPRSLYVRSDKVAALESALAKERERADALALRARAVVKADDDGGVLEAGRSIAIDALRRLLFMLDTLAADAEKEEG